MTTEEFNHRRFHGTAGTYEVWYLTWNHPQTDQGFWLRYLNEAPLHGPPRGELWFARFDPKNPKRTFGIHKHFESPVDRESPFGVTVHTSQIGHDHAVGELAGGGHDVHWDLRWEPADHVLRQLPDVMYARGGLGETTVLSPNPRVPLSGTLVVDGETLTFDRAIAGQTHVWGKKHAYSWVWGRCAEFAGAPDAVLELIGVRLQRRGITTPKLFLATLELDGEIHKLSQFRHVLRNRATWGDCRAEFTAWSPTVRIEGELTCRPEDMVNAPYVDPDGTELYCANTEVGDAMVRVFRRGAVGWREHHVLVGTRRAHFELGGRTRDPSVTREHVLVD
jgi:hypothetical protein